MSYESRTYDNPQGDPVIVLVVTGTHDVSRFVSLLADARRPNCEQLDLGHRLARQVRRHSRGRAALKLLRDHGGADFLTDPSDEGAVSIAERRAAADLHGLIREAERLQNTQPPRCACPPSSSLRDCGWRDGIGQLIEKIRTRALAGADA
jgi:hypothetical protein